MFEKWKMTALIWEDNYHALKLIQKEEEEQHLIELKECEKRADHWHDEWQKVSAKLNEVENEFTALKEQQPVSDKWFDAYESLLASYIRLWSETESLKKRNKRLSDFIVAWIKP